MWKEIYGLEISCIGEVKKNGIIRKGWNKEGYRMVGDNGNKYRVHRLVALAFIPNPNNYPEIDHINGIRDDNRIENLRWTTHQQNLMNVGIRTNNTTGIIGVCWSKRYNKWKAQLTYKYKHYNIGLYETIEEATEARRLKQQELFGVFVRN